MATARKSAPQTSPVELLERARAALRDHGFVKLATLGPAAARPAIVAALVADGFEATKTAVRKPVPEQLLETLGAGSFIAMKSIAKHTVGATLAEAKAAASRLVREGKAHLVIRTRAETLVPSTAAVVAREELAKVRDACSALVKELTTVTKKPGMTVLCADLKAKLEASELGRVARSPDRPEAPLVSADTKRVLRAVHATRDERMGMSFVPSIIRQLAPELGPEGAQEALVEASRRGLVELRPESGLARLTEEELALCPAGPGRTRLSWARPLSSDQGES